MILPFCATFMTPSNGRLIPHEIPLQNVRNKNSGCRFRKSQNQQPLITTTVSVYSASILCTTQARNLGFEQLPQTISEHDGGSVVQRDGVDVGAARWKIARCDVEDPFLAVPAEGRIRVVGVHDILDRGRRRS